MAEDFNKISITKTDKKINKYGIATCRLMGNIVEIKQSQYTNKKQTIQKLNNEEVLILSTGEIKQIEHISNRSQNKLQVSLSLKRLRDYINTNVTETDNCKWITLTYAENMTDTKRLYKDFKNFVKRFRYTFKEYNIEYIVAMEPQARGAWHCHLIFIFDRKAPFIPNKKIAELWEQGFTNTHKLDNIDNIGAYLTAYLGDLEYSQDNVFLCIDNGCSSLQVKEVNAIEGIKLKKPKRFIKGRSFIYVPFRF